MIKYLPHNVRAKVRRVLSLFRRDKSVLFLLFAVALDFFFTTLGLVVIGSKWEGTQIWATLWSSRQYLGYFGKWFLIGLLYLLIGYMVIQLKTLFRTRLTPPLSTKNYEAVPRILNLLVLYFASGKLYFGPVLWSIALACNIVSSVSACATYVSSNPVFAILYWIFRPTLGL